MEKDLPKVYVHRVGIVGVVDLARQRNFTRIITKTHVKKSENVGNCPFR